MLNYSTLTLREIFALEEARDRSQLVADRLGPSDFNMPWMNARADLIAAELLLGELGTVERLWPSRVGRRAGGQAWEHWLVSGRLAIARAQLELGAGRLDDAVTWSRRALELAQSGGASEVRGDRVADARSGADGTGLAEDAGGSLNEPSPSRTSSGRRWCGGKPAQRWRWRSDARRDPREERPTRRTLHGREAAEIIEAIAAGLSPERAKAYLTAAPVVEALELPR